MSILKKAGAIICLLAIMVSSTGISLQKHSCSMANKTYSVLFPEIFGAKTSCCCMSNVSAMPASGNGTSNVSEPPCCKSTFSFSKITTFFENRVQVLNPVKSLIAVYQNILQLLPANESQEISPIISYWPPPPKLYGIILLHFTHQLKLHLLF
jgi:hypothetical protein